MISFEAQFKKQVENVNRLVYYEVYDTTDEALIREKRLKKWKREWKDNLISGVNPGWRDLLDEL